MQSIDIICVYLWQALYSFVSFVQFVANLFEFELQGYIQFD